MEQKATRLTYRDLV